MATAKKASKTAKAAPKARAATKSTASKKVATKAKAPASRAAAAPGAVKPIKEAFTKTALAAHVAEQAGVDTRTAKNVLAALEATMLGSVHKKGKGEFTLPGLLKIVVQQVPAKKRRFGVDPFTKEERWFDAKPASVRIKVRSMKKLKDAAM